MARTRLATTLVCGALLALPLGAAGLYTTYETSWSAEASCRGLRTSILSVLEQNVDEKVKRALVHKDLAEFERSCALRDPEATAVFSAFDRTILFTADPDAGTTPEGRPVRFMPPPRGLGPGLGQHRWPGLVPPPEESRRRPFGT
jgi:hypothetical protein